jgi:hypothetical protein
MVCFARSPLREFCTARRRVGGTAAQTLFKILELSNTTVPASVTPTRQIRE